MIITSFLRVVYPLKNPSTACLTYTNRIGIELWKLILCNVKCFLKKARIVYSFSLKIVSLVEYAMVKGNASFTEYNKEWLRYEETSILNKFNHIPQAHARVCEENSKVNVCSQKDQLSKGV